MKILVFGTGGIYQRFKHFFEQMEVIGLIDNDPDKWGTHIDGYNVVSPRDIRKINFDYIFLASVYYESMRKQLLELGIEENKIIDCKHKGFMKNMSQSEQYMFPVCQTGTKCRKRILMFSHMLNLSGAPVVFCRLAKVLKSQGYDITVIAEKNSKVSHHTLLYQLLQEQISVIMVSCYDFFDIEEAAGKYDLFWVSTVLLGDVVTRLLTLDKKVYWWLHETDDIYVNYSGTLVFPKSNNLYVLTGGWMAAESFKRYSGQDIYQNLMYGIWDLKGSQNRERSGDVIKFGIIASYSKRKGHDVLINVIKKNIRRLSADAEFYFAGVFPEDKLAELKTVKIVHLLGELSPVEVEQFYNEIDVLLAPSLYDPMPVVVTEAMQHKRTCLVSDMVGQAKYITDKIDGVVCNAGSEEDLIEKINWIIENKSVLHEMGIKSYKIYSESFSMESFENNVKKLMSETAR